MDPRLLVLRERSLRNTEPTRDVRSRLRLPRGRGGNQRWAPSCPGWLSRDKRATIRILRMMTAAQASTFLARLRAKGMTARDAAVLARVAAGLRAPHGVDEGLLPCLEARLP